MSAVVVYVTRETHGGSDVRVGGVAGCSEWWNFVGGRSLHQHSLNKKLGVGSIVHAHRGTECSFWLVVKIKVFNNEYDLHLLNKTDSDSSFPSFILQKERTLWYHLSGVDWYT